MILLITGCTLLSVANIINPMTHEFANLSGGYSPWWLMYLYLLGAGIKKYNLFADISAKKSILLFLVFIIFTWLSMLAITLLVLLNIPIITPIFKLYTSNILISYISPTILAASVFFMLFCLKTPVSKALHRPLSFMAPLIFQVYIIHQHFLIWDFIGGRFEFFAKYPMPIMIALVLLTALGIFTFCLFLDYLRLKLFKLFKVNYYCDKLADFLSKKSKAIYDKL